MTTDRDILMTAKDLAERWGTTEATLAQERHHGRGAPYVKLGHRVRYRLHEVRAFEEASVVAP